MIGGLLGHEIVPFRRSHCSSTYTIKQYEAITQPKPGLAICLSLRIYNCFERSTMAGDFDAPPYLLVNASMEALQVASSEHLRFCHHQ